MDSKLIDEKAGQAEPTTDLDLTKLEDAYRNGMLDMDGLANLVRALVTVDVAEDPEICLDEALSLIPYPISENASRFGKLILTYAMLEERIKEFLDPVVTDIPPDADKPLERVRFGDLTPESQHHYLERFHNMVARVSRERRYQAVSSCSPEVGQAVQDGEQCLEGESNVGEAEPLNIDREDKLRALVSKTVRQESFKGDWKELFALLSKGAVTQTPYFSLSEVDAMGKHDTVADLRRVSEFFVTYAWLDVLFREMVDGVAVGMTEDSKSRPYLKYIFSLGSVSAAYHVETIRNMLKQALNLPFTGSSDPQ